MPRRWPPRVDRDAGLKRPRSAEGPPVVRVAGSATHGQGAGIPKTLPQTFAEQVREWMAKGWVAHDGTMIEVAHHFPSPCSVP